jgi:hypothetical protein
MALAALALPANAIFVGSGFDADTPAAPWSGEEQNLYEIYNFLFNTSYADNTALEAIRIFEDDWFSVFSGTEVTISLVGHFAALDHAFGWFAIDNGSVIINPLFDILDPNFLTKVPVDQAVFQPDTDGFGFYDTAGAFVWFSDAPRNPVNQDHMVMYRTNVYGRYVIAWEDRYYGQADQDFNDIVLLVDIPDGSGPGPLEPVIPEPASLTLLGIGAGALFLGRRSRRI